MSDSAWAACFVRLFPMRCAALVSFAPSSCGTSLAFGWSHGTANVPADGTGRALPDSRRSRLVRQVDGDRQAALLACRSKRTANRRHKFRHSQGREGIVSKQQANRLNSRTSDRPDTLSQNQLSSICTNTPKGTRTPVLALRGLCPRPLDDGGNGPRYQRVRNSFYTWHNTKQDRLWTAKNPMLALEACAPGAFWR